MKFLEKIDHLKMLRFALGISIFSVGYLITMFYFQMNDIKEFKQQSVMYNNENINILHLESDVDADVYYVQSQVLSLNISPQKTRVDDNFVTAFLEKNSQLQLLDNNIAKKNNNLKLLLTNYIKAKDELLVRKLKNKTNKFNQSASALSQGIEDYSKYIDAKIKIYNENYELLIDKSKISGFLIALISLVIFVLAYVKMNEDLIALKQTNDEIIFMNETLNNAEMVAGFGSWKINLVHNTFLMSDNFYRLLGVKPKEFEPSLAIVMSYIHPEDREEVQRVYDESLHLADAPPLVYRYLLPDGTIKNIASTGKSLLNSKGESVRIGVNQDITELMKKSQELEDKNLKLIATNSELESFNNIISHDLQEPLRKIQMFISRIENKEFFAAVPESTVTYFDKIKSSASRMQNLMTDLVDYTRTIKSDRKLEQVNLNEVFDEIVEELALVIEEKNAVVNIDQLPTILGTRFQIQQLFVNLISNALKYVKSDVNPRIAVQTEKFSTDILNDKTISGNDFHKITITDNGIGFEQKFADHIFLLFKRLETNESYKGTGLGLAICKKIVDNNNGFITVVSEPGKGSKFTVYLPKTIELS